MSSENTLPFDLSGFAIERVEAQATLLNIQARSTALSAVCPYCGCSSTRVHSYYTRCPRDLPCNRYRVRLVLRVRRFRCANRWCSHRTFAERLPHLVAVHAQRTVRLTDVLRAVAFVVSAETGARVTQPLQMPVSGDTLLRILRQTQVVCAETPRVLGIDDWAFRKGRRYGTLLVDLERHRPVDVLPDAQTETVAAWLRQHPGIEVVSRDRSSEYIAAITQGAPQAIQVADRWHLLKNLGEALERVLARHPKALRTAARIVYEHRIEASASQIDRPGVPVSAAPQSASRTYRQMRFAEVKALAAQGYSRRWIAHHLHMHRSTVAHYLQLDELPPRVPPPQNRSSVIPYLTYLQQRWEEGGCNAKQLWHEISTQGYPGSYMSVWRALKQFHHAGRQCQPRLPPAPPPLSPRQAMWLLVKPPEQLTAEQIIQREALCDGCAEAAMVSALAQRFGAMIRDRQVDELDRWLDDARTCGVVTLRHFADGLQRDYAAVRAALLLEWSSGQVEGQVNRLKVIKRQMYGRARFDLLRLRVLHPP